MIEKAFWADDGFWCEPTESERGSTWSSTEGDETMPSVQRPIGFMRHKPRVRIKAWSQPIVEQ